MARCLFFCGVAAKQRRDSIAGRSTRRGQEPGLSSTRRPVAHARNETPIAVRTGPHGMIRSGLVQRSFAPPDHALAQRVSRSAAVSLIGVALRAVITIGSTAVLARLLSPADFGLLTMASLVTEFAALFSSFGIGAILIQMRRSSRLYYDTAFWFAAALGLVLMAAVWLFSVFAGLFFDDPQVGSIVRVLSVLFLLEELTVVHSAVLNRLLKFKLEVAIQMGQLLLRVGATIAFAWLGWGVWSLVLGSLAGSVFRTAALWIAVPFRPRVRFHWPLVAGRMRTGLSYLGGAVLGYLNNNLDYLVVGRSFGAAELGYYQAAYSLSDELRNRLSLPLQRVLFPAYSLVQDDLGRFQRGVSTSLRLLSCIVFPLGAGMAATAPEIVAILFGPKWLAVIPLLQVLAINGALRAVFSMCGSIYFARDRADLAFLVTAASLPLVVLALWLGSRWGAQGVAWAMLAMVTLSLAASGISLRLIRMTLWDLLRAVGPAAIASAAMAAGLSLRFAPIETIDSPLIRLGLMVVVGALVYVAVLCLVSRDSARLILNTLKGLVMRRRKSQASLSP